MKWVFLIFSEGKGYISQSIRCYDLIHYSEWWLKGLCWPFERTIIQLKKNISRHKTATNLGLSPSTVQNLVKRKSLLNVCDLWVHRQHCMKNRHATMMNIPTWAWEYFGKSLPLNSVRHCIQEYNLKILFNSMQICHSSLDQSSCKSPKESKSMFLCFKWIIPWELITHIC